MDEHMLGLGQRAVNAVVGDAPLDHFQVGDPSFVVAKRRFHVRRGGFTTSFFKIVRWRPIQTGQNQGEPGPPDPPPAMRP